MKILRFGAWVLAKIITGILLIAGWILCMILPKEKQEILYNKGKTYLEKTRA